MLVSDEVQLAVVIAKLTFVPAAIILPLQKLGRSARSYFTGLAVSKRSTKSSQVLGGRHSDRCRRRACVTGAVR